MNFGARRWSTLLAALLAALSVACNSAPPKTVALFPVGQGIRKDTTLSGLQAKGWTVCYEGAYADGTDITATLDGCTGQFMLLGCRASDATDALALAAADLRKVVTQPDTTGQHHVANGVGWYFNDVSAWGFFPASEAVNLDPCDTDPPLPGTPQTMKDQRMCWHAVDGALTGGYRCGDNQLNTSTVWRRLVMVHN